MKNIALFLAFLLIWNNLLGYVEDVFICISNEEVELVWESKHHKDCETDDLTAEPSIRSLAFQSSQHPIDSHHCAQCEDIEVENNKSFVSQSFLKSIKSQALDGCLFIADFGVLKRSSLMLYLAPRGPPQKNYSSILNTSTVVLRI